MKCWSERRKILARNCTVTWRTASVVWKSPQWLVTRLLSLFFPFHSRHIHFAGGLTCLFGSAPKTGGGNRSWNDSALRTGSLSGETRRTNAFVRRWEEGDGERSCKLRESSSGPCSTFTALQCWPAERRGSGGSQRMWWIPPTLIVTYLFSFSYFTIIKHLFATKKQSTY